MLDFNYKNFVKEKISSLEELGEKKFLDAIKDPRYKPHWDEALKPRKRRLRKKKRTHEFQESTIYVEFKQKFKNEEEWEDYIYEEIEPFIEDVRPMTKANPEYPQVSFDGGVGGYNGKIDSPEYEAKYMCGFGFPYIERKDLMIKILTNIKKSLKHLKGDYKLRVYLVEDSWNGDFDEAKEKELNHYLEKI